MARATGLDQLLLEIGEEFLKQSIDYRGAVPKRVLTVLRTQPL
jgi:hypothetical protein